MIKRLSYLLFKILMFFDSIFKLLTKRSFMIWFKDFFHEISYKYINIFEKKVKFFVPNHFSEWRVDTFFTKEPDTLEWINNFEKKENLIFWDIGANIGLYSIYNALKNKNSTTISFEPSSSNFRILSRNISINNLENNIKIFPIALTNKVNTFLKMKETDFVEGGSLNSFGEKFDFEGKEFKSKMRYQMYGTNIDYLIDSKILDIPDYIKIDVDGIEHLILAGANKHLGNQKIKSLLVEINENFIEQKEGVLKIMKDNKFKLIKKNGNEEHLNIGSKWSGTFNYHFVR